MYHSVNSQRYRAAKGMKVKHLVQLVALTVLFTWFLYQLNTSHKAKVLSLRAEKADDVDDELLITSDVSGAGLVEGAGAGSDQQTDHDEVTEIAHEEFIDTKSVFKSRKELRPVDTPELEQTIAEADRVDDVGFDDSGEGDGDGRGLAEESVRRIEETEIEPKVEKEGGVEYGEALHERERAAETTTATTAEMTADDRGDGEDDIPDIVEREGFAVVVPEERAVAANNNPTVPAEFGITEDQKGNIEQEEFEIQEAKTVIFPSETVVADDDVLDNATELAGSEFPGQIMILKSDEAEKKNLTKNDGFGNEFLQISNKTETESATGDLLEADKGLRDEDELLLGETGANLARLKKELRDMDRERNVTAKVFSRPVDESSEETLLGPVNSMRMQSGADSEDEEDLRVKLPADADAKAGHGTGVGDILSTNFPIAVDDRRLITAEDGPDPGDLRHDGLEKLQQEQGVDADLAS